VQHKGRPFVNQLIALYIDDIEFIMSRSARLDAPGPLAETGTFVTSDVKALPAGIRATVLPFESVTVNAIADWSSLCDK
jgi:hypothetical protein